MYKPNVKLQNAERFAYIVRSLNIALRSLDGLNSTLYNVKVG